MMKFDILELTNQRVMGEDFDCTFFVGQLLRRTVCELEVVPVSLVEDKTEEAKNNQETLQMRGHARRLVVTGVAIGADWLLLELLVLHRRHFA